MFGSGRWQEPFWRVVVEVSPLEMELLRSWPVRRLAFVAHAGAVSTVTSQSYSRLDHSLGLFALVAHFAPDDATARAAALVHDVGHPPLSHTLDGIRGVDHHELGRTRITGLRDVLDRGGLDVDEVLGRAFGPEKSVLTPGTSGMKLDHFESYVRSGLSNGLTTESPQATLAKVEVRDGAIVADAATAEYVRMLLVSEARYHASDINVIASAVVRNLVDTLLGSGRLRLAEVAAMTDLELWAALLADPSTAEETTTFLRSPWSWRVEGLGDEDCSGVKDESIY